MTSAQRWMPVMVVVGFVACGRGAAPAPTEDTAIARPVAAPWTRAEWLAAVDALVADPATMPRLDDAAGRARFTQLLRPEPWSGRDADTFAQHGDELVAFFPAFKRLTLQFAARGTVDEVLAVTMFGLDAFDAIITSGEAFLARMPPTDPTLATRRGGLDKMRLGVAIDVCGALYTAQDASSERRTNALTALAQPARYAGLSRDGLQLILATLDEQLLPPLRPELRTAYQAIRATVAQVLDTHPAPTGHRTTYQGIAPGTPPGQPVTTVVSRTGGFSVRTGPAALAKRVDVTRADGATLGSHWIELQDGAFRFEAVCFDGTTEATLVAGAPPSSTRSARPSSLPGAWSVERIGGTELRGRIVTVGERGCIAGVSGPAAGFPGDRADAFLASLAPAP